MKNRQFVKDLLETQILEDAQEGDTTVLAEIISHLDDNELFEFLSDDNQNKVK
jgi:hypothetical protein